MTENQKDLKKISKKLIEENEKIKASFLLEKEENKEDFELSEEKENVGFIIDDLKLFEMKKDRKTEKKDFEKEKKEVIGTFDKLKEEEKEINPIPIPLSKVWEDCYDGKYELVKVITESEIIYDKGIISSLKVVQQHKNKVINKFKRYVVSYVLAGSLVRGEATKDSDVDVFVVVDDTDVKRMSRTELKEKLRAIIIKMGYETTKELNVENNLNIQVYILTDFWESLKDANPVIYTFIRDGVPLYDKGTFMPWKKLLKKGMIQPSIEAINKMFVSGEKIMGKVEDKIKDIVIEDLFYAMLTPSQSALMLYGLPPSVPKETPKLMRKVFTKEDDLLEEKYVKMLEKIVKIRKDIEHGKKDEITGKELDKLKKDSKDYLERLNELVDEIEVKREKEQITEIYDESIHQIRSLLKEYDVENINEDKIIDTVKERLIKNGKAANSLQRDLKKIIKGYKDFKSDNLKKSQLKEIKKSHRNFEREIERIRDTERIAKEQGRIRIFLKDEDKKGELYMIKGGILLVPDIEERNKVKIYKSKKEKWEEKEFKEDEMEYFIIENIREEPFEIEEIQKVKEEIGEFKIK